MIPVLYPGNETEFVTNGIGRLSSAIRCNVQEALNGKYELEMIYPIDGAHFSEMHEHMIIYSDHDDTHSPQPFEIYRISRPMDGKVTINAAHISYRLNKSTVAPFSADGLQTALVLLKNNSYYELPFEFSSDKTTSGKMEVKVPTAIKTQMGGVEGSFIDVYGGEWEFDHFRCILRNHRGQDNGVNIRYGKNLTDIVKTTDATNLWTGIVPFWSGAEEDGTEKVVVSDQVIYSANYFSFPYRMIVPVDASSNFQTAPTAAQLRDWGRTYVNNNAKNVIPINVKISFVQLWQTEEYKDVAPLQRVGLGDTVTVYYDKLGVDNTTRVVEYDYNVLLDHYDSITLGEVNASLAQSVKQSIESATKNLPTKSFFEVAIERATKLITGGLGGYVIINTNANGQPNEILVMNTDNKDTATQVLRINKNGIGFGSGYNGPFNSAWTLDGTFDAQQINVINLTAAAITTGILKDAKGYNFWNLDTGEFQLASTATVGGNTVQTIANNAASGALSNAKSYTDALNNSLVQQEIFNRLTNNGQTQGIYLSGGKLYINATYIATGKISSQNGLVYFDLDNNEIVCSKIKASTPWSVSGYSDPGDVIIDIARKDLGSGSNPRWISYANVYKNGYEDYGLKIQPPKDTSNPVFLTATKGIQARATSGNPSTSYNCAEAILKSSEISFWIPVGSSAAGMSLDSSGANVSGNLNVSNVISTYDLQVTHSKNRNVKTAHYGQRLLASYETPTPMFGDSGEGIISNDGMCIVMINDIFAETVRTDIEYQVFLQKEGRGDLWVDEKNPTYFIVKGDPNLKFAWEIKAIQAGFETDYMEDGTRQQQDIYDSPEALLQQEIYSLIDGQEGALYETA